MSDLFVELARLDARQAVRGVVLGDEQADGEMGRAEFLRALAGPDRTCAPARLRLKRDAVRTIAEAAEIIAVKKAV